MTLKSCLRLTTILLCLFVGLKNCTDKVTFEETLISYKVGGANNVKSVLLTGRITLDVFSKQIGNKTVVSIYGEDQDIPVFNEYAISNMEDLQAIKFNNCKIRRVKTNAFVNLPKLKVLDLQNNLISTIDGNAFVNVFAESLELNKNKITFLEPDVFASLRNLKYIILSDNELETFEPEWFGENINLDWIDMQGNFMRSIQRGMFVRYQNLMYLELGRNKIQYIHQDAFKNNSNILTLGLDNNKLKKLSNNLFESFRVIEELTLNNNNLTFMFDKNLNDVNSLKAISIHSNPWQCSCYQKILEWADSNSIKTLLLYATCLNVNNPVCIVPKDHQNECLEDRDEDLNDMYYRQYNYTCR